MKSKAQNSETYQKLVTLCFDEMYTSHKIEIDQKNEQVVRPHRTCQVGMVRRLFEHYKQLVYYDFDKELSVDMINQLISDLYDNGFIVVALTCDFGSTNQGVFTKLNVGARSNRKCYFPHLKNSNYKVFAFADIPHLLKLLRNHFIDSGFEINGRYITKDCIEDIIKLNKDANSDVSAFYNITNELVTVKSAERQKVSKAAKLMSNTVSRSINFLNDQGLLKSDNCEETSEFIKLVDSWFDFFNSKCGVTYKIAKEPCGKKLEKQNEFLTQIENTISNLKVINPDNQCCHFKKEYY